jgi:hypothetical protein
MTSADELTKRLKLNGLVVSNSSARPSLQELKGLGKEVRRSIDIDDYLHEERRSWH